jgi:hypothetical protein
MLSALVLGIPLTLALSPEAGARGQEAWKMV